MRSSAALVRSMLALRADARTGLLRVDAEGTKTFVYLREGVPVFAEEGSQGETLGRLLVRKKVLTQEQYVTVIRAMTDAIVLNEQLRFGEIAVELGFLTEADVMEALVDQVRWKIVRCFQKPDVTWEFMDGVAHLDGIAHFPMRIEALFLEAARWIDDEDKGAMGLAAARDQTIAIEASEIPLIGTRFQLNAAEKALLKVLDGRTVRDVLASPAAAEVDAPAILTALIVTRTVTTSSEPKLQRPATPLFEIPISPPTRAAERREVSVAAQNPAPAPARREASVVAQNPAPAPARREASVVAQNPAPAPARREASVVAQNPLGRREGSVVAQNPLDRREGSVVGPNPADRREGSVVGPNPARPMTRASRILQAISAQKVSIDADRAPENEHEAKLLAERACQAGLEQLRAGRFDRAAPELARASRLLPSSDEYKLYAKWAQVRASSAGGALHPLERSELKKLTIAAIKADPNFAFAHYVAGSVARDEDDILTAHRFLAHAVKLDPTLTDAQRQLRIVERIVPTKKKK